MSAGEHLSAVRQRIAQLQRELPTNRVPDASVFEARLRSAMADAAAPDGATPGQETSRPPTVTLGQYLGTPGLGALARVATAHAPSLGTGPSFHGVALTDPIAAEPGSGYGQRRHPVLGSTRMHHGQDYGAATGTPIRAAAAGTVVFAGERGGYGNLVEIDHGNGVTTRYAHASRIDVTVGQQVGAGDVVAAVGSTGLSTGPHLHFELRHDGVSADPADWLPGAAGGHAHDDGHEHTDHGG